MSEKSDDGNANLLKEWETARTLLSFFDDKSHDLRKYGFSFITALIAADGLILSIVDPDKTWPNEVKFAILFVNILLIVGLAIIDRNYHVIQRAANTRARVLERRLNLELSEVITQRFWYARVGSLTTVLYLLFVVAVMFLGFFALSPEGIYWALLVICGIIAMGVIIVVLLYIRVEYPYGKIDWTVDRLRCTRKDKVYITLTNLNRDGEETLKFPTGVKESEVMWVVRKEGDTTSASGESGKITTKLEIEPGDSYTWFWEADVPSGVYRLYRLTIKDPQNPKLVPFKKKIIVEEKTEPKPKPIQIQLVK